MFVVVGEGGGQHSVFCENITSLISLLLSNDILS